MNVSERARLKRELLQELDEPTTFERMYRHVITPVALVVLTVYAISAICYLAGSAVIWLWEAFIGK